MSLIELESISKVYYADEIETHALQDVSFGIDRGEFVAVEGPSGCGKSTLLAILGLLDSPTSGSYMLDDIAVDSLSKAERTQVRNRSVGFVFQAFNLIGDITVAENVEVPLMYRNVSASERRDLRAEVLDRVGMTSRMNHYPGQLSGGQQQRVAVARAIIGNPAIVLADEPTGNLDSENGARVMDLLTSLNEAGTTICMVTHDPRYADLATRTISLFDGCVVDETVSAGIA